MEETIRDTFVDLKVDVIKATLMSMENTIASRFTAVDVALAQLVSPTCQDGASDRPHSPALPDLPAPPDAATDCSGSAQPMGAEDSNKVPPPNSFQATTMFNPGSSFPAGKRGSHMPVSDNRVNKVDHGTWRQQDRADSGDHTQSRPRAVLPTTASTHYRDMTFSQAPYQRHPGDADNFGTSPTRSDHNLMQGRRDMRTDTHRDHHWSFDEWDDEDEDGGYVMMGGPIKSPSNIEQFRQARQRGMSQYDTAALANKDYHGGERGFDPLTIRIIKNCGYTAINSDDILLCYRDIIHLHRKTLGGWTNMRTQHQGPLVEWIMEKAMPLFQKLNGVTMADLVHFYDNFQKTGSVYLLPVMPFDAVNLKLGFEGLCPPGLGVNLYSSIAAAIMEVVPRLLPDHIARLTTTIATIRGDSNNGFDLLWRLMALAVPGFDPAQHVSAPVWDDYRNIFDFCHAYVLYFRLQAKQGLYYDDCTRSSTFLRAIHQSEFIEVITTLQTHIESYQDMDMGYLLPSLCMMELATATVRVSQYGIPQVNRIFGIRDSAEEDASAMPLIQGSTPVVFQTEVDSRGRDARCQGIGDN
jgi:hypothetical protein